MSVRAGPRSAAPFDKRGNGNAPIRDHRVPQERPERNSTVTADDRSPGLKTRPGTRPSSRIRPRARLRSGARPAEYLRRPREIPDVSRLNRRKPLEQMELSAATDVLRSGADRPRTELGPPRPSSRTSTPVQMFASRMRGRHRRELRSPELEARPPRFPASRPRLQVRQAAEANPAPPNIGKRARLPRYFPGAPICLRSSSTEALLGARHGDAPRRCRQAAPLSLREQGVPRPARGRRSSPRTPAHRPPSQSSRSSPTRPP